MKPYYIIFTIIHLLLAVLTNNKNKKAYTLYLLGETLGCSSTGVKYKDNSDPDFDHNTESESDYNSRALLLEQ
ncbi:hypothetical protein [Candidatus Villigracilis saccharophilus]|uniref:hypothetical protein n=1 Tax=Candidatus Villigracilis saccharophilus TaxID=3140684 RepID=UPI003136505B|nr:hypothetical protein [Anaerolineales bacterium]